MASVVPPRVLRPGARAYWFNTLSLESRPVVIVRESKDRFTVETEDGHRYQPLKGYVSADPVDFREV